MAGHLTLLVIVLNRPKASEVRNVPDSPKLPVGSCVLRAHRGAQGAVGADRWRAGDMAPTTRRHRGIVANILAALHTQLHGTGHRPTCSRTGVRTGAATIRYPVLVVDFGRRDDHGMCAATPVLVIKVLSASGDPFDTHQRVSEYKPARTSPASS